MNIKAEKQQIVEALQERDEEWLIIAIKKLLDLDEEEVFSEQHHHIIKKRIEIWEEQPGRTITAEQLEKEWKEAGKL
jgi:hypothetical protein